MKRESYHADHECNHVEYRRAIELFKVQLWIVYVCIPSGDTSHARGLLHLVLHKLLLICVKLAFLTHQG